MNKNEQEQDQLLKDLQSIAFSKSKQQQQQQAKVCPKKTDMSEASIKNESFNGVANLFELDMNEEVDKKDLTRRAATAANPNQQHQQEGGNLLSHPFHSQYQLLPPSTMYMYKFDYKPQFLFDNLQNLISNNPNFAGYSSPANLGGGGKSSLPAGKPHKLDDESIIDAGMNYGELDEQLEDLARIKLEDIDELNSFLTTTNQDNEPPPLSAAQVNDSFEKIEHQPQPCKNNNFVLNIIRNVCNFSSRPKESKVVDLESTSINLDDDLLISLINDTKKNEAAIQMNDAVSYSPNTVNLMNPSDYMGLGGESVHNEDSNLHLLSVADNKSPAKYMHELDLNNNELECSKFIKSPMLSVNTNAYTMNQPYQQLQQLPLDFQDNKEFFLDTDVVLDNPTSKIKFLLFSIFYMGDNLY